MTYKGEGGTGVVDSGLAGNPVLKDVGKAVKGEAVSEGAAVFYNDGDPPVGDGYSGEGPGDSAAGE